MANSKEPTKTPSIEPSLENGGQYDPKTVEKRLYDYWEKLGVFKADANSSKKPFVIIQPPPNVTGVLHMGHALTSTIEDILVRRKRMEGFEALWLPGTDHAGIATQMVVERHLMKEEKVSRHDLGREKFLERVWEWKRESEGTILSQQRKLGCSLDWSRLAFTLDEGVSRAVREAFFRLWKDKLIYREQAIIQWCPRCRTALSDLEVKMKEVPAKLWHLQYKLAGNPNKWLTVATTRPETLIGDVAVAVHPDDERYAEFHGKKVVLPLVGREIPVITDAYVDQAFGTGALKITPGHDVNDYAIGKRHGLPILTIFDDGAKVNELGGVYQSLSREKAREKMLEDLKEAGLLEKETDHKSNVGTCDRCATVLEPKVSTQWFVKAEELAKDAIRAVESGEIKIIPSEWEKTYFEWMRNIRPWCVSRQLWWGHRIPVWYCGDCTHFFAAVETPTACEKCKSAKLTQDDDVLDTWFSSGLWPISTLGWPGETADMKKFYPTDVMETGFDILFFWVARMIMLGMKMTGKIPFHTVYLHPMVRDEHGQKMSKTKGNVKDPLEIVERMGADSLRFTLAAMSVHGRDVLLSDARIEGYRNFVNKIWNASRFVLMHFGEVKKANVDRENEVNRWIWSRLDAARRDVNQALDQYRFFDAANRIYQFIWSEYCDWFIELIKGDIEARKQKGESTAIQVLDEALRLLHPIMPFVTEEIWQKLPVRGAEKSISLAAYPKPDAKQVDTEAERRVGRMIALVDAVRSKRGESNLAPSVEIQVAVLATEAILAELRPFEDLVKKLAKASKVTFEQNPTDKRPQVVLSVTFGAEAFEVRVPREELLDTAAEKSKTEKDLESSRGELERAIQKLGSPEFTGKAPEKVIAGVKERRDVLEKKVAALEAYLKTLI